jgi:CheY-like chemotaxis protein
VLGSAWPVIGEAFERALAGETSYLENQRMFLDRNGYLEETFFTFSFSPILDESGGVGGLFHPVRETTAEMVGEGRARVLRASGISPASTTQSSPAEPGNPPLLGTEVAAGARPRILWVDDNADMRDYVGRLLGTSYDVTTVSDGTTALATALAIPPDLILSDIMMPGLDGFAPNIRFRDRTSKIIIIL